jgi:diaminopimelate decarboxylase
MPAVKAGEKLAILDTGAYGYSMASNYNSRPRPAEVLVRDGNHHLIRKREEIADVVRGEILPSFLD